MRATLADAELRPYGGVIIPDGLPIALERALAAFSVQNEIAGNQQWRLSQYTAEQDESVFGGSQRVWWKLKRPAEGPCWISLNPGEFRETEPDPPDVVRDLPEDSLFVSSRQVLQAVVKACEAEVLRGEDLTRLQTAKHRLSLRPHQEPELPPDIRAKIRRARHLTRDAFVELVHMIYGDYLQGGRATVDYLTPILVMLQLQAAFQAFVVEDWFAAPRDSIPSFVAHMVNDTGRRAEVTGVAQEICDSEYESGRAGVQQFLRAGQLRDGAATLLLAYHRFQFVRMIVKAFEVAGAPLTGLIFTDILIEEAAVCAMSGLFLGARFLPKAPETHAEEILSRVSGEPTLNELRKMARMKSTEVHPIHPRMLVDIHAAQALTLCRPGQSCAAGIAELLRLRDLLPFGARFESGLIDLALVAAYRRQGNDAEAHSVSLRLATQIVIARLAW